MRSENLPCKPSGIDAAGPGTTEEPLTKTNLPTVGVQPKSKLELSLHLAAL